MKRLISMILLFLVVFSAGVVMAGTAGDFQWPFAPYSDYRKDQYHMEYNGIGNQKYHMGEDWNATDGSDLGDPLYALADGQVVYIYNGDSGDKGKRVIVRYTLPGGTQIDSEYMHCNSILVNWSGPGTGDIVAKGQQIATIGQTGNTTASHLHWGIQTDLNLPLTENPYQNPISPAYAMKYTSPSLFVDDRLNKSIKTLSAGSWTFFTVSNYAPSSTAYFENGDRYTIQGAINAGLILNYGVIYQGSDGLWYYYNNPMDIFFEPGTNYAIYSNVASATFNILAPGNNYPEDRARIDMIKIAAQDTRFNEVWVQYFAFDSEDVSYVYRVMPFHFQKSDGTTGAAYFYHATSKTNPLIRYVCKYVIDTGMWEWVDMDRNSLY